MAASPYVQRKLHEAALLLRDDGQSLALRLVQVRNNGLLHVLPDELPEPLRADFQALQAGLSDLSTDPQDQERLVSLIRALYERVAR